MNLPLITRRRHEHALAVLEYAGAVIALAMEADGKIQHTFARIALRRIQAIQGKVKRSWTLSSQLQSQK